jgi:voltage-gated potassium channel
VSSSQDTRGAFVKDLKAWILIGVPLALMLYVAWYQVIFDSRDRLSPSDWVFAVVLVSVWLAAATWAILRESSLKAAVGFSVYSVAFLIGLFASLYLGSGSPNDWSQRLSQLDAVTFAMGTFTTAGTFGVTPVSQTARGLVTLQMGMDVIATVVIFGLLAARLAELRSKEP